MAVLLRQAKLIDPSSPHHDQLVDVLIENGTIASVGNRIDADAEEIRHDGMLVSAGWVDLFADYREPGFEQKETIATGLDAAAAGGFTDVLLLPNTAPVIDNKSAVRFVAGKAAGHPVRLHPLGALSQGTEGKALAEMLDMRAAGAIAFTDGWKPVQGSGLMMKALEYVKAFDGILLQLPVDASLAAGGLMHEGKQSTRLGMPGIPVLSETLMIQRDIELVRYTGSRLHITGVSAAASLDLIRAARAEGLDVTCSVTPYHLALTDEALQSYSSAYKVTPPLRTEADRQALIAGLKDGTVDCIASHHRPQDWDAKAKEFEYAGEGMALQELVFPVLWTAVKEEIGITRVIEAMTSAPRKIFGLPEVRLEAGSAAAITIFTTEGETVLTRAAAKSIGRNNPFLQTPLAGKVIGIHTAAGSMLND